MKLGPLFLIMFFTAFTFGQDFQLPEQDVEDLKAEIRKHNDTEEAIYLYLVDNFDTIAKKREVVYLDYGNYRICSFNQEFENDINYSIEECREAGGTLISLVLPKTDRQSLVTWIEMIYESYSMGEENTWDPNKTKYEPINKGVGCYFEIKETEKYTLVENYCGC